MALVNCNHRTLKKDLLNVLPRKNTETRNGKNSRSNTNASCDMHLILFKQFKTVLGFNIIHIISTNVCSLISLYIVLNKSIISQCLINIAPVQDSSFFLVGSPVSCTAGQLLIIVYLLGIPKPSKKWKKSTLSSQTGWWIGNHGKALAYLGPHLAG